MLVSGCWLQRWKGGRRLGRYEMWMRIGKGFNDGEMARYVDMFYTLPHHEYIAQMWSCGVGDETRSRLFCYADGIVKDSSSLVSFILLWLLSSPSLNWNRWWGWDWEWCVDEPRVWSSFLLPWRWQRWLHSNCAPGDHRTVLWIGWRITDEEGRSTHQEATWRPL